MTAKRDTGGKSKSVTGLNITSTNPGATTTVAVNNSKNIGFVSSTQQNSNSVTNSGSQDGLKRTNKPLMEKRRRARINQSLAILKALILESTKANSKGNDGQQTKHTKLEKADILELTVRHFQRHRNLDDPTTNKYRAGYTDCAREVARYLATPEPPPLPNLPTLSDPGSKARLLRHLDQCIAEIDTEICPHSTTYADSPSSSCFDLNSSKKTQHDDNSMDYSSQDSNPLDFSKNNREKVLPTSATTTTAGDHQRGINQAISSTSDNFISSQDENNNRGHQTTTDVSSRLNGGNISDMNPSSSSSNLFDIKQQSSVISNNSQDFQKKIFNETFSRLQKSENSSVLVLPPHYVQLAAALGLNTQTMIDPLTTAATAGISSENSTILDNLSEKDYEQQRKPPLSSVATSVINVTSSEHLNAIKSITNALTEKLNSSTIMDSRKNNEITISQNSTYNSNSNNDMEISLNLATNSLTNNNNNNSVGKLTNINFKEIEKMKNFVINHHLDYNGGGEQNQNNQNLLNQQQQHQQRQDQSVVAAAQQQTDDNMWRP